MWFAENNRPSCLQSEARPSSQPKLPRKVNDNQENHDMEKDALLLESMLPSSSERLSTAFASSSIDIPGANGRRGPAVELINTRFFITRDQPSPLVITLLKLSVTGLSETGNTDGATITCLERASISTETAFSFKTGEYGLSMYLSFFFPFSLFVAVLLIQAPLP